MDDNGPHDRTTTDHLLEKTEKRTSRAEGKTEMRNIARHPGLRCMHHILEAIEKRTSTAQGKRKRGKITRHLGIATPIIT